MDVLEQEQLTFTQALDHWYYRVKYEAMMKWIQTTNLNFESARVADFGCGAGLFLKMLLRGGIFKKENLLGIDSAYCETGVLSNADVRVVPNLKNEDQFDLFLLMDVLEHIEDDREIFLSVFKHCSPGGYLFVTVPAMEWLWSGHDFYLGHKRRYTLKTLANLFSSVPNLEILGMHYFYASILPIVIPLRLIRRGQKARDASDMRPASMLLNKILKKTLQIEISIMKKNRFCGLTALALCKKKNC